MQFLDIHHPFYRPLPVRIGLVLVSLGWGLVEFVSGAPFWGILFSSLGAYCAWQFLVVYPGIKDD